jgi:hypothetical protein
MGTESRRILQSWYRAGFGEAAITGKVLSTTAASVIKLMSGVPFRSESIKQIVGVSPGGKFVVTPEIRE